MSEIQSITQHVLSFDSRENAAFINVIRMLYAERSKRGFRNKYISKLERNIIDDLATQFLTEDDMLEIKPSY